MIRLLGVLVVGVALGLGCGSQGEGPIDAQQSVRSADLEGIWALDVPAFVAAMNDKDPRFATLPLEQREAIRTMLEKHMSGRLTVRGDSMMLRLVTGPQVEAKREVAYDWKVVATEGSVWTLALIRTGESEEKGVVEWVGKGRIRLTISPEAGEVPLRLELIRL